MVGLHVHHFCEVSGSDWRARVQCVEATNGRVDVDSICNRLGRTKYAQIGTS
jgi:hypothetical protein